MNCTPKVRFSGFKSEWLSKGFADAFSALLNNTLSRAELNDEEGSVKNIHYGDVLIKYGSFLDASIERIPYILSEELAEKWKTAALQNGDVVIADTAEDATVGKCTEVGGIDSDTVVSGLHTIPVRPLIKFSSGYLGYYMNTEAYHSQLLPLMQGTKVSSISKSALSETTLRFPAELTEQSKMAELFVELDRSIIYQQQKCDKLIALKAACLDKMFPKNGSKVPELRFAGFNGDWEQRKLGEVGKIVTGTTPSTAIAEYYSEDGMPWVTPTDIVENVIFNTERRLSFLGQQVGRIAPANTILVTCIASIGKNTLLGTTGSFNQQINGLIPDESKCDPYFLLTESALWSARMKKTAAVGTMQIVNRTEFSELRTWLPQREEQRTIGDFFRHLDYLITLHQRKREKLRQFKQAMLQKMFV